MLCFLNDLRAQPCFRDDWWCSLPKAGALTLLKMNGALSVLLQSSSSPLGPQPCRSVVSLVISLTSWFIFLGLWWIWGSNSAQNRNSLVRQLCLVCHCCLPASPLAYLNSHGRSSPFPAQPASTDGLDHLGTRTLYCMQPTCRKTQAWR